MGFLSFQEHTEALTYKYSEDGEHFSLRIRYRCLAYEVLDSFSLEEAL